MSSRKLPAFNTAQMADISFLLLTFFMMTSAINVQQGIPRRLPPPSDGKTIVDINQRNIFQVIVNFNDDVLANGEVIPLNQLTPRAKEFLENPLNNPHLPEKDVRLIENMGEYPISKGVLSLQNDQSTSYNMYVQVQNELQRAVNELRDKVSLQYFGRKYELLDTTLQKAVQKAVPMNISEAPPSNYGKEE
ncbi:MAG: biopolymer transporter ExbD [Lentimicrobiaceae bacterium]|nr:biopolymer transporter ExbD [Lentimicrobiaceae bacterium]